MVDQTWSAKGPLIVGALSAAVLVGGMGYWSVETEISGAVVAPGTLEVENDRQVVQHPDGGVISEILVRNGQQVSAGETLFRLDDVFLKTELRVIEGQLAEIFVRKARLVAERDDQPTASFGTPPVFETVSAEDVEKQMDGQRALLEARSDSRVRRKQQIERQQSQVENKIESIGAQVRSVERQTELIEMELSDVRRLLDSGLAQQSRLLQLERTAAELEGQAGSLGGQIAEARNRISTLELEKFRIDDQRREDAITELRNLEVNERELTERRTSLIERLGRLNILAPVDGVVFESRVFANRSVIQAAEPLLYLVPDEDPLHVSAKIDPIHVDQVFPGQEVALVFSAFSRRTTPEGQGRVGLVSADATIDEITGVPFYEAIVIIDDASIDALDGLDLIPGMPVETFFKTDARTPLSYLVQPLSVYFARAFREE